LERKTIPDDLSFRCAGGDLLFICLAFAVFIIAVIILENETCIKWFNCFKQGYSFIKVNDL